MQVVSNLRIVYSNPAQKNLNMYVIELGVKLNLARKTIHL